MNDGSGGHRQKSRMTVFDLEWKYQFPRTMTPVYKSKSIMIT